MANVIASLIAEVGADISGFMSGMNTVKSTITNVVKNAGSSFSDLGRSITVATAPLSAFGVTGIKVASDFGSAMAEISARTGLTGKDLETVRQTALKLGADTVFSAQDAADAMLNLLASGQSTKEMLATLPSVLDAAAASGESLASAADTVTNILASFQLKADQSAKVVNTLAQAAAASKATMGSLGQGFANIGPIAKQFGLNVEDTAAILAIFEQNGIRGAEAGTQLRSMLTHMTSGTKAVEGAWKRLGVSMFDATGKARPIADVMRDISKAMKGMNQETRTRIFHDLAGSYGQMGLASLTSSISIEQMKKRMKESASVADVVKAKTNTFAFAMESLRGSIEALQINALTPLMDNNLRPMVEQVTKVVNAVGAWIQQNPVLAGQIVQVLAGVTVLGPALFVIGQAISAIGGIIAFIVSPIGLLIAGIVALGVAFQTNFLGIRDAVMGLLNFFGPTFEQIRTIVSNFMLTLFGPGDLSFKDRLEWAIHNAIAALPGLINAFMGQIGDFIAQNAPVVAAGFRQVFNDIGVWIVGTGWPILQNFVSGLFTQFGNWVSSSAWPAVQSGFTAFFGSIGQWFSGGGATQLAISFGQAISDLATWLNQHGWETLQAGFSSLFLNISNFLSNQGTLELIKGVGNAFIDAMKWIVTTGIPIAQNAFNQLIGEILKILGKITQGIIDSVVNGVRSAVHQATGISVPAGGTLSPTARNVVNSLPFGLNTAASGLLGAFGFRAGGGPVAAGGSYIVGERGPELLTMGGRGGYVTPNGGGGGDIYITLDANRFAQGIEETIVVRSARAVRAAR